MIVTLKDVLDTSPISTAPPPTEHIDVIFIIPCQTVLGCISAVNDVPSKNKSVALLPPLISLLQISSWDWASPCALNLPEACTC